MKMKLLVCYSCPGVSDVAVRPTERCTAAFQTAPPLTVSTPPTNPTTAVPSVRLVRLTHSLTQVRDDERCLSSVNKNHSDKTLNAE